MRCLLCLVVLGCSVSATPNEETTVGSEVELPDEPLAPLRPEDALGFATMDPSLEEDACLPSEELNVSAQTWRVSDTGTLVWLPCQMGAYQPTGALFWVNDDGQTERIALPHWDANGTTLTEDSTGSFSYDASTHIAEDLVRFRGLGDCGRRLRYRVGTVGLTLIEHREQPCDDSGSEHTNPDDWPQRTAR